MNTEIKRLAAGLQDVLSGVPWYGKPVLTLLDEVNPEVVFKRLHDNSYSMIDLLYHMITWSAFTRQRLEKTQFLHTTDLEALNWRETSPEMHTWNNGISQFTSETNKTIEIINNASDDLLEEKVDYREYNFRYLLNGLIQHNIYHAGQIAYLNKLLK